jgi:hypothetical protein
MKKIFGAAIIGVFAMAAFSSCQKCTTCEIKDGDTVIQTYPETCGSSSEIDDFKQTVEDANAVYEQAGFDYEIICTDN